jgi:hypothetical protein
MRGDQHRDAELRSRARDQAEHVFPAGGIESVRRLVEQEQLGIVDERLRQFHTLLHARGVAADQPVPLLVQSNVPQHLGGALARGLKRQPRHPPHVRDKVGTAHVDGETVVLGHVPDHPPNRHAVAAHIHVEHRRATARWREQPEKDADERRLPGAIRADESDDAGFHVEAEIVERDDAVGE